MLLQIAEGEAQGLADLVELAAPWLLPVANRLEGGDEAAAERLCEALFADIWRLAPCYDAHFGPPLIWMLSLLRERGLAAVVTPAGAAPLGAEDLAALWFGEEESSSGA